MDENKTLNEVDEVVSELDAPEDTKDELRKIIGDYITSERSRSVILGYRVACQTILQIIARWRQPNCSHREYERIFKQLEEFCGKALKQKEESSEETVQN